MHKGKVMMEQYQQTIEKGTLIFHGCYRLYNYHHCIAFDSGAVRLITLDVVSNPDNTAVQVIFHDSSTAEWNCKWITSYNFQFGIAPSADGKYLFVQTWENGLFCLDAHTGEKIWRTKSKRGITNIFVHEDAVLCHQHDRALQRIDIHTGEVLEEKRAAAAWGFTALNHKYIVCRVTARQWEIVDAATLETMCVFSHRAFTGGHEDFCVNGIQYIGQELIVRGFRNVWDDTVSPAKMLPNEEFEHRLPIELDN